MNTRTTPPSSATSCLWNARLLWVERATANAEACANWYADLLGDTLSPVAGGLWQLRGSERWLLLRSGAAKSAPSFAFAFPSATQRGEFRAHLERQGVAVHALSAEYAALLDGDGFSILDPDGRQIVFAVAPAPTAAIDGALPGRLQHFVVASTQTLPMLEFYRDTLGFVESDRVVDSEGDLSSAFVRSDPEHHSFAVFRAPASGPDHHAYDVPNWNAIRDWADHCGDLEIPLWWGPGRHGVGNNLFFMIEDPDGYKIEFSTELEHMPVDMPYREWPHGPRALNLWGSAWMRS